MDLRDPKQVLELKRVLVAKRALDRKRLSRVFDPYRPGSKPNPKQQEIFDDLGKIQFRYIVSGNQSGKSSTVSRELAWILNDDHPTWKRPEEWGNEPLLILIACQDLSMGQAELWEKKLKPFLNMSEWNEQRQGNSLKRVVNKVTGDQIILLSHSDGSDKNRKHMQGYTAHYVWLDEMPSSWDILEELQLRVQAKKGFLIAPFTPKFRNDRIRKTVDAGKEPYSKKYSMSKFDNPIFADQYEAEMSRLAGQPQSVINTILYGDWATGENAVYSFNYEEMTVAKLPESYSPAWRHVESVDPALTSTAGYTLWAEDPHTAIWYLVNDEYIEGSATLDPETLFQIVQKRSQGYNVVRRISDTMPFFLATAAKHGVSYQVPYRKNNNRKDELIKGLQTAMSSGTIKIARWCTTFIDEVQSCQFREDSDVIVKASKYHTLDCSQYFCDSIPKHEPGKAPLEWQTKLRIGNDERIQQEVEKRASNSSSKFSRGKSPEEWAIQRTRRSRGGFR